MLFIEPDQQHRFLSFFIYIFNFLEETKYREIGNGTQKTIKEYDEVDLYFSFHYRVQKQSLSKKYWFKITVWSTLLQSKLKLQNFKHTSAIPCSSRYHMLTHYYNL